MTEAVFTLGEHSLVDSRRRRLGIIVPASNTNAEPDYQMLAPPGLTLHFTRSGGYDVEAIPDSAEMRRFARQQLDQQLQLLVDSRVELIAYACTSATLSEGPAFDAEFCAEITAKSGLPAVTTAGALVEATHDLGAPGCSAGGFHIALCKSTGGGVSRVPSPKRHRCRQSARFRTRIEQPRTEPADPGRRLSHGACRGSCRGRTAADLLYRLPRAGSGACARAGARQTGGHQQFRTDVRIVKTSRTRCDFYRGRWIPVYPPEPASVEWV